MIVKKKQFNNKGILVFNQNEENQDPNTFFDKTLAQSQLLIQNTKNKRITSTFEDILPYELQMMVCLYLNPREIALTMPRLSKYWHKVTLEETKVW